MSVLKYFRAVSILFILVLSGCAPATALPGATAVSPTHTPASALNAIARANDAAATQTSAAGGAAIPACDYQPGKSVPAQMPADVAAGPAPMAAPTPFQFSNSPVDAATTEKQLAIYQQIWNYVNKNYVATDFQGKDWKAIGQKYQDLIKKGFQPADFYQAMKQMLFDLDSGLSGYLSPEEVSAQDNGSSAYANFVGIGGQFTTLLVNGAERYALVTVFPGSPADKAGLKRHDSVLKVDGGPVMDDKHQLRTLGPEGSSLTLTVQSPGQSPREVTLRRARINLPMGLHPCLFAGTRIGFIYWLDYTNNQSTGQVIEALKKMSASGPLEGLIIDTRVSGSGDPEIMRTMLGLFTKGELGSFISRGKADPFTVDQPLDVAGSQSVPLVLLQDASSGGMNLLFNGLLQLNARARIVGTPNNGPLYNQKAFDLSDLSRVYVANQVFQPKGKPAGYFDRMGVAPDVSVPARWDLFTDATDPLIAKAVELLQKK